MKTKKNRKKVTKQTEVPPTYDQDPETPGYLTHWKTREGEVLAIREMQFDHLLNARALLRRKIAKFSEIEEALSREVHRRSKGEYRKFVGKVPPEFFTLLGKALVDKAEGAGDQWDDWDNYGSNSQ
jgi:hypothetical protein